MIDDIIKGYADQLLLSDVDADAISEEVKKVFNEENILGIFPLSMNEVLVLETASVLACTYCEMEHRKVPDFPGIIINNVLFTTDEPPLVRTTHCCLYCGYTLANDLMTNVISGRLLELAIDLEGGDTITKLLTKRLEYATFLLEYCYDYLENLGIDDLDLILNEWKVTGS